MDQLNISLSYEWQPVFMRDKVEYLFPLGITPFMRAKYKEPAVFRWNIYQKTSGDKKLFHLDDAQELCPRRLYGYINPGPTQQTTKKIKTILDGHVRDGLNVGLDICLIHELKFGDSVLGQQALGDRFMRQLVQAVMTVEHRKKGFTLLEI
jgi:hypothetical protein